MDKIQLGNFSRLGIRKGDYAESFQRPPANSDAAIVEGQVRSLEASITDTVSKIIYRDGSAEDMDSKPGRVALSEAWQAPARYDRVFDGHVGVVLDFDAKTKQPIRLERTVRAQERFTWNKDAQGDNDLLATSEWVWSPDGKLTILEQRQVESEPGRNGHSESFWAELSPSGVKLQQSRRDDHGHEGSTGP